MSDHEKVGHTEEVPTKYVYLLIFVRLELDADCSLLGSPLLRTRCRARRSPLLVVSFRGKTIFAQDS